MFFVTCFSLKEKKGPAAARNLGWKKACGKLVFFTDDDCIPAHGWIDAMWTAYCRQPGKTVAFTGQVLVPRSSRPTDYEKNIARLENAGFITANCACSKSALLKVKGLDEDFLMAWREDSALEFKLIRQQVPIHFIQQAVVVHPVRKAGRGVSLKEQRKSMFNALLYKKYPLLYSQKIRRHPAWNYYAMILLFITGLLAALAQNQAVMIVALAGWLILEISFIKKRLTGTLLYFALITEMVVTSAIIPFLSVYRTLYGAVKFKTRFL